MNKIGESKLSEAQLLYVPKAVLFSLRLVAGDMVEWFVEDNKVIVKKKEAKQ